MKFMCTCGNVINTTGGFCKEACVLYNESEYILWNKFICDIIPMKEYDPSFKRAFFCDECKRYSVFEGEDLYVFMPYSGEIMLSDEYESYHLIDEFESEEICYLYEDTQKRNEATKSDFSSLPKTRMMNISFKEKKAYIENLDGSIETYIAECVIKR
ncbi:MAG: hypothetical protein K2N72_04300 [Oscillospiraceae bacterium]|nr:hypothetical protein [Oscillospiraceae bacterium]